jgi:hypothetical protein
MAQLSFKEESFMKERRLQIKFADNCGFKINGKTNVNSFECACEDQSAFKDNSFYGIIEKGKIDFQDAILNIPVSSISCGNKLMNSDLYSLLKSEKHPHIKVHFLSANWDVQALWDNDLAKSDVIGHFDVVITIAGVSRSERVEIHQSEIDQQKFILATSGEVNMNLHDFNIEPPVKFMGMVKVKENINLELDLVFHWSEIPSTDG